MDAAVVQCQLVGKPHRDRQPWRDHTVVERWPLFCNLRRIDAKRISRTRKHAGFIRDVERRG